MSCSLCLIKCILILLILFFQCSLNQIVLDSTLSEEEKANIIKSVEFYNLGTINHNSDISEAIKYYKKAIELIEEFPEAHQNIALLYSNLNKKDLSFFHIDKAFFYARDNISKAITANNLFNIKIKYTRHSDIQELLQLKNILIQSLNMNPSMIDTIMNIAFIENIMGNQKKYKECCEEALKIHPNFTLALLNLGNYYFTLREYNISINYYLRASNTYPEYLVDDSVKICPQNKRYLELCSSFIDEYDILRNYSGDSNIVLIYNNLAQSFRELGNLDEALLYMEKSLDLALVFKMNHAKLLAWINIFGIKTLSCNWKDIEYLEFSLEKEIQRLYYDFTESERVIQEQNISPLLSDDAVLDPYTVSLFHFTDRNIDQFICKRKCQYSRPSPLFSYSIVDRIKEMRENPASKVLKIGYLSYDWRDHPMGRLTMYLVTSHNSSNFLSKSLSYGFNDRSKFRDYVAENSEFYDFFGFVSDLAVAKKINEMNLDILIDLTTHTYNGRIDIAALKPSGIIINYLGFAGTTGCLGFDYTLADKNIVPVEYAAELFSEKMIFLSYSYQANAMPKYLFPGKKFLFEQDQTLKETESRNRLHNFKQTEPFIICSFNAYKKMEPISFLVWANILRTRPNSVMLLIDTDDYTKDRLSELFSFWGILFSDENDFINRFDGASRVIFQSKLAWEDHLSRLASTCDLVLDNFIYGAHTTASDVLFMWTPLLSLESWGEGRMPSRVAGSIIKSLSYDNSCGKDIDDIERERSEQDFLNNETFRSRYFKAKSYIQPEDILLVESTKAFERTANRLLSKRIMNQKISSLIGYKSLRSPHFNEKIKQHLIERSYEAVFDLKSITTLLKGKGFHLIQTDSMEFSCKNIIHSDSKFHFFHSNQSTLIHPSRLSQSYGFGSYRPTRFLTDLLHQREASNLSFTQNEKVVTSKCNQIAFISLFKNFASIELNELNLIKECFTNENIFTIKLLNRLFYEKKDFQSCEIRSLFAYLLKEIVLRLPFPSNGPISNHRTDWFVDIGLDHNTLEINWLGNFSRTSAYHALEYIGSNIIPSLLSNQSNFSLEFFDLLRLDSFVKNTEGREILGNLLNEIAHCSLQIGKPEHAIFLFASSLKLIPAHYKLLNIGIILTNLDRVIIGNRIQSLSNLLSSIENYKNSDDDDELQTRRTKDHHTDPNTINQTYSKTIAIYCNEYGQAWWPGWGPTSNSRGMGGSEEAVFYLSLEMARDFDYHIYIFADISEDQIGYIQKFDSGGKIIWKHYHNFDLNQSFDLFIAWRYTLSLTLGINSKKVFLWLHDLIGPTTLSIDIVNKVDGILLQSQFHKSTIRNEIKRFYCVDGKELSVFSNNFQRADMAQHCAVFMQRDNFYILPNGITLDEDIQQNHSKDRFIYASSPSRGLEFVLEKWPMIKEQIPSATLEIYYGFTPAVNNSMKSAMGLDAFERWFSSVSKMMKYDGIRYIGSVGHKALGEAMARSGFLLYPTRFPETGCITIIRAMAFGTIPITSRFQESVLDDLTFGFDLGPRIKLNRSLSQYPHMMNDWLDTHWLPSVFHAYNLNDTEIYNLRNKMVKKVRRDYNWKNSAKILLNYISN